MSVIKDAKRDINASMLLLLKDEYAPMAKAYKDNPKYKNFLTAQDVDLIDNKLVGELQSVDVERTYHIGKNYYVTSRAIEDFKGEIIGYLVCGKRLSEVDSAVSAAKQTAYLQTTIMAIIGALMTGAMAVVINAVVKKPVLKLKEVAEELASGDGDLTKSLKLDSKAKRTQKSLTEINATINTIVQSIIEATEQMNKNADDISNLAKVSAEVGKNINTTVSIMSSATGYVEKMAEDTIKIAKDTEEIVARVNEINKISSSNTKSVEEIASVAEHLYRLTEELSAKLNEFKT